MEDFSKYTQPKPGPCQGTAEGPDGRKYKVTITFSNPTPPTGLARVAYQQHSWDAKVKLIDRDTKEVLFQEREFGSLYWRVSGNTAFSIPASPYWEWINTLSSQYVPAWSYKTSEAAANAMLRFILRNLRGDRSQMNNKDK